MLGVIPMSLLLAAVVAAALDREAAEVEVAFASPASTCFLGLTTLLLG
jgi:hypothetical protein